MHGFFAWAMAAAITDADPTGDLPSVRPSTPVPRPAPERVYADALAHADDRARMIVRLAAEAGLRRAEISQVTRDDLFEDLDGWSLRVQGKGERVRVVPLSDSLAAELRRFIGRRQWAFPSPTGDHLTPRHIGKIGRRVLPEPWTLHTLRHRFATVAHEETRDLIAVQRLLGHASVATTQRYVATDRRRLRRAVEAAGSVA
ncbi:tyrosine-type recombinase/integrase [Schaalia vaccimaxillae]|uniref:tyrosine-type recombinase/integrase n=1 Tax=Schaalia vaccimaxillae TaxID=183916 RepID=UPI001A93E13E|nr:tyrosine-type recombinase/integrase [Schaalia vaccimaxillae]